MALLGATGSFAGSDLNEVGALLVYPTVVNLSGQTNVETFVTITNAGPTPVFAHVSYINGNSADSQYCYECDFTIPLTGNDTETLVVTYTANGTAIQSEDTPLSMSCPWQFGMMVVAIEDGLGGTLTDNVLLGEEVIIDYTRGTAVSIPAVPFQGGDGGDGNRVYSFDDSEYGKMPRIVAADFLAPNLNGSGIATLSLFTLGFERQFPPLVDCSVTGFDAHENPFSASFQFGCWGLADLCDISPEFCYPNLGLFNNNPLIPADTHGWLQLNCRVDSDPWLANGFDANGGVHGAIIQTQNAGSQLAAGNGQIIAGAASWARLLYQSVTTGDPVTLLLEEPATGLF
jgi:hypothetical protein